LIDLIRDTLNIVNSSYQKLEIYPIDGLPGETANGRTGLELIVERRTQGDRRAVVLYGFDSSERVKQRSHGEILKAPGVFYLKLPSTLGQVNTVLKKAKKFREADYTKAEKAVTYRYALQQIRSFKHRCDNLWMSMQSNINRIKEGRNNKIPVPIGGNVDLAYMELFASEYKMIESMALQTGLKDVEKVSQLFVDIVESMRSIETIAEQTTPEEKKAVILECVKRIKSVSNILSAAKEMEEHV